MRIIGVSMLFVFLLTGCNTLLKETKSGYAEGVFENKNIEHVSQVISVECLSASIRNEVKTYYDPLEVECRRNLNSKEAFFVMTVMPKDSYVSYPDAVQKFSLFQDGNDAKVVARQWVEAVTTTGVVRKAELNSNAYRNDLQKLLFKFGAK